MRLIKAFLHTFFFTIYYWDYFKFHQPSEKIFDKWRDNGHFAIFGLFTFILLRPIVFLFYCIYVVSGSKLTEQDANLYSKIAFPAAILSMIYVTIRLKKEKYIEGIIEEVLATDEGLIKKRYKYTLYTVLIPFFSSPLWVTLLQKLLQRVIVPMF